VIRGAIPTVGRAGGPVGRGPQQIVGAYVERRGTRSRGNAVKADGLETF